MSLWQLVLREIWHRRLNFVAAFLSVALAVGCLVAAMTRLRASERETASILAKRQREVESAGAELKDAMRKITKGLGFNILILPEDQDLDQLYLENSLSKTMPEPFVQRLAESDIVTVNHLLPVVLQRVRWTEHDLPVVVMGTRGEVPIMHRDPKKPLLDLVPPEEIILGFEVHQRLGLKPGDKATFQGREFTVGKCYPQRGSIDDSTVWLNLGVAQEMFGLQNLLHGIWALECHCAGDRITQIRQEIEGILPGTQVVERFDRALARAEARSRAEVTAKESLEQETASRAQLHAQQERFAAMLVPVTTVLSGAWVALLSMANVRRRRTEIGLLRALGLRTGQVFRVFWTKSLLVGLAGALVGVIAGQAIAQGTAGATAQLEWDIVLLSVCFAPLLAVAAGWIPATLAARQDPALILHEE